jgi:tRNA A37 threonylcarbamoyladenosine dehydratase
MDINPECCVRCVYEFVTPESVDKVLAEATSAHESSLKMDTSTGRTNFVLDMVDSVRDKAAIIHYCGTHGVPVVSCGGAGDLRDPELLRVSDLARAEGDALIMKTRKVAVY